MEGYLFVCNDKMTDWEGRRGGRERRGGVHIPWYKCKWTTLVEICLSPIISPSAHNLLEPSSPSAHLLPTHSLTHLLTYLLLGTYLRHMKEREKICSPKTHERKRENLHIPAKEVLVYYHVLTPLYYWNSLTKNEELAYYTFNSYLMNMHHHPILCFHTFHLLPPTPTISFLYWAFALPRQGRKEGYCCV